MYTVPFPSNCLACLFEGVSSLLTLSVVSGTLEPQSYSQSVGRDLRQGHEVALGVASTEAVPSPFRILRPPHLHLSKVLAQTLPVGE